MSLTLAAVGAIVVALLQATVVPFVELGGARPDLLIVYCVVVALIVGLDHGVAAAFIAGTTLDAIASRPLGSSAFILLLVVGAAAVIGRLLARGRALAVVLSTLLLTPFAPLLFLAVYSALRAPIPTSDPWADVVPDTVYTTAVALVVGALASRLHRRYFERDRIDW